MDDIRPAGFEQDAELLERHIEWAEDHDERQNIYRDVKIIDTYRVTTTQIVSIDHLRQEQIGLVEQKAQADARDTTINALAEQIKGALNIVEEP